MVVVSRRRDEFLYFSRRGEARSEKSRTMKFCDARYAVRLLESARRKSSYRAPASSVVTSSRFSTNDSITPPAKRSSPPLLDHFNFSIFDRQVCDYLSPRLLRYPCFFHARTRKILLFNSCFRLDSFSIPL